MLTYSADEIKSIQENVRNKGLVLDEETKARIKELNIKKHKRGKKGGKRRQRKIQTIFSSSDRNSTTNNRKHIIT